ncbi:hypothetical protein CGRA01v4_08860 [Colletotrichum graminicola]|nr:hypothetical protein CGRA01v4_08860 [Colletotrichum graminicola]
MIPGVRQKIDYHSHVTPLHDIFFLLFGLDFVSAFGLLGRHHTPLSWLGWWILGCNVGMVIPRSMCCHFTEPAGCGGKIVCLLGRAREASRLPANRIMQDIL